MIDYSEDDLISMIINSNNFLELMAIYSHEIDKLKNYKVLRANSVFNLQPFIYCLLLKTSLISFKSKSGIKKKMEDLMNFINEELGVFLQREVVLCYWFLMNRNDTRIAKFFKLVQSNSKKLISVLQGMSWDLFHIRNCIEMGIHNDTQEGKLIIHYLVTHDNGLSEVIDAYPIKFLISKKDNLAPITVFAEPLYETIPEIDIEDLLIKNKEQRTNTYQNNDIDILIKRLEHELADIIVLE